MKYFIVIVIAVLFSTEGFTQKKNTVEVKMKVKGICGMCETRIEEAANFAKGVKSAEWDKETDILTVVYKEGKTTPEEIGKAIAKAGHDNEFAKASNEDYDKISNCCRYKTQEKH